MNRLRAVDSSTTLCKASGLLLENPTKRLLLRYVEAADSDEALERDLTNHFKFARNQKDLVTFLRNLVETDFERGVLMKELSLLENQSEAGLRIWFEKNLSKGTQDLDDSLERKLVNAEHGTMDTIFAAEMLRAEGCVIKFDNQASEIILAIHKLRVKSKRVLLSLYQVRSTRNNMSICI